MTAQPKDLLLLVADADIEQTMRGLLENPMRLGIRSVSHEIKRHPERDAGCARHSVEYLRLFHRQFHPALVMFDHEGSGRESESREELEASMEAEFARNGWKERSVRVIALEPEIEAWVWSPSPHVADVLGWSDWEDLRQWLVEQDLSASLFKKLAHRVSHRSCRDAAFAKLRSVLRGWFGAVGTSGTG